MGKGSYSTRSGETKGSIHVLQQAGVLLLAHLGNISTTILKDKEMSKSLRRMTDLLLRPSKITKEVYQELHEHQELLQIQLIQVHVHDL